MANAYQLISIEQVDGLAAALEAASNTPSAILASLLTVDGPGSGLNADLFDGYNSTDFVFTSAYTAADVLSKLLTVDGASSTLDADLLDGQHGSYYNAWGNLTGAPEYAQASASASLSLRDTGGTRRVFLYGDGDGQGFLNTTLGGYIFRATAGNPAFTISGNVFINGNGIWHAGNDGAGSTLDADLLDGQHGSYYRDAGNLNAGTILAARMPAFTGDATSVAGAVALTFATVNGNVGSFGSATAAPTFTVNAKGLITAAGSTTITPAWSSITSKPTTLAGYGITDLIAKTDTANVFTEIQTISGVVPGIKFIETDQTAPIGGWTINLNSGSFYIRHNTASPVNFATQNIVMDISNAEVVTFANTPSAFGNAIWHAGNDGASSGLDADLLDGQQGSYYQNAGNLNAGTILAARMPALTGDITTSAGAVATTLATVNGNVGSFGSATAAAIFTVNAKGLITAASSATITPAWSSITSTPTTISGYGITNAVLKTGDTMTGNLLLTGGGTYAEPATIAGVLSMDTVGGDFTISSRSNGGNTSLAFRTSAAGVGAERMRINSSGQIGIGKSNPSVLVDIESPTAGSLRLQTNNGNAVVWIKTLAGGTAVLDLQTAAGLNRIIGGSGGTSNLGFYTDSTERMRIDASGNLAVGDTATLYDGLTSKLSVLSAKSGSTAGQMTLADSTAQAAGVGGSLGLVGKYNDAGAYAVGARIATQKVNSATGNYGFDLAFWTRPNAGSLTQNMVLTSTGSLGIGTTSPSTALHVTNSQYLQMVLGGTYHGAQRLWMGSVADSVGTFIGGNAYYQSSHNYMPNHTSASGIGFRQDGSTEFWNDAGLTSGVAYLPTKRMTILANGNVGIGTGAPTLYTGYTTLAISHATNGGVLDFLIGGTRHLTMYSGSSTSSLGTISATHLAFMSSNAERMRLTAAGDLGIGTSSPSAKLEALTTVAADADVLTIRNASTDAAAFTTMKLVSSSVARGLLRTSTQSGAFDVGNPTAFALNLFTNGVANPRLTIDASGNVGIGTTTPGAKLHVKGSNANGIRVDNAGEQYTSLDFYNNNSSRSTLYFDNTVSEFVMRTVSTAALGFDTNLTRRLTISSTGAVTIVSSTVTAGGNAVWHAGNDGAGSTLDADLLDGQQGSYYQNAGNLNAGTILAARMPALTGDVTSSAGAVALTLATVNGNVGSFGSATAAPTFTVNAKGLITAAGSATITPAWSSITSTPTTITGYGITDAARINATNTFTAGQIVSTGAATASLRLDSAAGQYRWLEMTTASARRWLIYTTNSAETGSNVGADFVIGAYNDAGSGLSSPIIITRSTGVVTLHSTPLVGSSTMWHAGNDGAGSTLDADLLDGQQGSYYLSATNINAGTLNDARLPATMSAKTFSGRVTLSVGNYADNTELFHLQPADYGTGKSRLFISQNAGTWRIGTWDGTTSGLGTINFTTTNSLQHNGVTIWTAANDGAGSTLDADLLDGQHGAYYRDAGNLNAGIVPDARLSGTYTGVNITGNAATATALATGRTMAITGDLTWTSPSFNGSANVTAAGTLATVNGNVGSFGSATAATIFTVNAKGLITAASSATITPAWSSITSKPTTLAGYGITDAIKQATSATINGRAYDFNIAAVSGSGAAIGGWDRQLSFTGGSTDTTGAAVGAYGTNQTATYAYIGLGTISTQYTSTDSLRIYPTYAAWGTNVIWHAGNDGAGSTLDADLLDGQQGSYYLSATNINAGTLSDSYLPTTMAGKTFSSRVTVTAGGEGVRIANDNAYYSWYNTANNSRNGYIQHSGSTITLANEVTNSNINLTTTGTGVVRVNSNLVWHAGNDGAGSTLDADMLDGQQGSYYFPVSGGSFTGNISIVKASPAITINDTTYVDPSPLGLFRVYSAAGNLYITRNTATNRGFGTESSTVSISGTTGAWNFTSTPLVSGGAVALVASPTFTGTPAAPTATAGTNTTQLATTAFVTTADNLKANIASPTFTGTPAAPTATAGTNTTQLATTAFVTTADNLKANVGGGNATGTWPISVSGSAASIAALALGYSTSSVSLTAAMQNQLGYVAGVSLLGQTDGGLYQAGYDTTSWRHQIFGDFRTGQILIRGQSSGTYQAWRTVWDSGNDGAGSTLDADLLDGQQGAWYAPIASPTFTGTVTMPAFSVTSDQRLKTDIEPLQGYSEFLDATKIYSFVKDGKHQFGVLAHEAQEVRPELVSAVPHKELGEVMTVNPMDYLFALVAEVQDLRKRIAELEGK